MLSQLFPSFTNKCRFIITTQHPNWDVVEYTCSTIADHFHIPESLLSYLWSIQIHLHVYNFQCLGLLLITKLDLSISRKSRSIHLARILSITKLSYYDDSSINLSVLLLINKVDLSVHVPVLLLINKLNLYTLQGYWIL